MAPYHVVVIPNSKMDNMAKIYAKEKLVGDSMKPKKETISFLLSYSKALSILTAGKMKIETIAN